MRKSGHNGRNLHGNCFCWEKKGKNKSLNLLLKHEIFMERKIRLLDARLLLY